jgi:hypothetical protein
VGWGGGSVMNKRCNCALGCIHIDVFSNEMVLWREDVSPYFELFCAMKHSNFRTSKSNIKKYFDKTECDYSVFCVFRKWS